MFVLLRVIVDGLFGEIVAGEIMFTVGVVEVC